MKQKGMLTVLSVFGTRPEAIKMAPVVLALQKEEGISSLLAVTAQHREMLDQVLDIFQLQPHFDLNIMQEKQSLSGITSRVLTGIGKILQEAAPDLVLVHGDTTTTFAAALASFYQKIPVGHVEAGLRTGDKYRPFPEEINRRLTDQLASYHYAPTEDTAQNLQAEGFSLDTIFVTGNTVIDALLTIIRTRRDSFSHPLWEVVDFTQKKVILLTAHRRENWGPPLQSICRAVRRVVEEQGVEVVFPVHLNPQVREVVWEILGSVPGVHLLDPLEYETFAQLMDSCYLILTDSGGIQEEAPSLGKPVLVLRDVTERPEAVRAGTVRLVGTKESEIQKNLEELLQDEGEYRRMAQAANPYGDGQAAQRIVSAIKGSLI